MTEDEIDRTLTDAGARLRADAPDAIATQQALRTARDRRPTTDSPRRNWWPTAIGIGMAGAAAIGVIAYNAGDTDDTLEIVPADSSTLPEPTVPVTTIDPSVVDPDAPDATLVPMTTLAPDVPVSTVKGFFTGDATVITKENGRCFEVRFETLSVSTTGCVDVLDPNRTHVVAAADNPYLLTEGPVAADGTRSITAEQVVPDDERLCGLVTTGFTGAVASIVGCNAGWDVPVALAARLPVQPDGPTTYFTTPHEFAPAGAEFGDPVLVVDDHDLVMLIGTTSDTSPAIVCLDVVDVGSTAAGGNWRESCWPATEAPPTGLVTVFDDLAVQFDVADLRTVSFTVLDEWVPPSSGCSFDTAKQLMTRALADSSPTLIFSSMRCAADQATTAAGSVLFQPGPPDGAFHVFESVDGGWVVRDSGTGLAEFLPHRNPSYSTWSAWPGETAPYRPPYATPVDPSVPTLDIGATLTDPAPSVDALAAAIVEYIDGLASDPDFPANTRLLAVEPDGLPLIVAQADVGGDDSVSGEVVYIWFEPVFDGAGISGYRVETTYVNQLCGRGGSPDSPLCL